MGHSFSNFGLNCQSEMIYLPQLLSTFTKISVRHSLIDVYSLGHQSHDLKYCLCANSYIFTSDFHYSYVLTGMFKCMKFKKFVIIFFLTRTVPPKSVSFVFSFDLITATITGFANCKSTRLLSLSGREKFSSTALSSFGWSNN